MRDEGFKHSIATPVTEPVAGNSEIMSLFREWRERGRDAEHATDTALDDIIEAQSVLEQAMLSVPARNLTELVAQIAAYTNFGAFQLPEHMLAQIGRSIDDTTPSEILPLFREWRASFAACQGATEEVADSEVTRQSDLEQRMAAIPAGNAAELVAKLAAFTSNGDFIEPVSLRNELRSMADRLVA